MRENDLFLLCETLREENAKLIEAVDKLSAALKDSTEVNKKMRVQLDKLCED